MPAREETPDVRVLRAPPEMAELPAPLTPEAVQDCPMAALRRP